MVFSVLIWPNAQESTFVVPTGIVNEVRNDPLKAAMPIVWSEFGSEIETRPVPAKAKFPILVTALPRWATFRYLYESLR